MASGKNIDTSQLDKLTRQQLRELEEKEKSRGQKILDGIICILPLVCGGVAVWEYLMIPDNSPNNNPNTYLGFLLVLIAVFAVYLAYGFVKKMAKDKTVMDGIRYKAPLYSALFLLLAGYDYLTLKTGVLTQPFVPCLNYVINAAWSDRAYLIESTLHTLRLLFLGYGIGVALGLVTGITCGYSDKARYWVNPVIKFLGPIPTSTWIPIIMVVASSLFKGAVFIIALGSWFAVTVASMTGIQNVDKDYFEAAKTLGANELQLVYKVAIPHAMPNILAGCTQAMSSSCVAIMIAEMMGVEAGLGWYMQWSKSWAAYDKMFAALFVICFIFTIVTKCLDLVKRYLLRWQIGARK